MLPTRTIIDLKRWLVPHHTSRLLPNSHLDLGDIILHHPFCSVRLAPFAYQPILCIRSLSSSWPNYLFGAYSEQPTCCSAEADGPGVWRAASCITPGNLFCTHSCVAMATGTSNFILLAAYWFTRRTTRRSGKLTVNTSIQLNHSAKRFTVGFNALRQRLWRIEQPFLQSAGKLKQGHDKV